MEAAAIGVIVALFIVAAFSVGYYLREPDMRRLTRMYDALHDEKTELLGALYHRINYKPPMPSAASLNVAAMEREASYKDEPEQSREQVHISPPDLWKRREEALRRDRDNNGKMK